MIYRFAEFELDSARFVLKRRGEPLKVEPKTLELLGCVPCRIIAPFKATGGRTSEAKDRRETTERQVTLRGRCE